MLQVAYMRKILRALVFIMWAPMPAIAATLILDESSIDTFSRGSWALVALAFGLSTFSSATALLLRIDRELGNSPDGRLPRPLLFVSSNLMGSWLAGIFAWLGSIGMGHDVVATVSFVIVASFSGAIVIEKAVEKYVGSFGVGNEKL